MGNLFGKPKTKALTMVTAQITEQDKAILQLKQQRDKLKQYQKRLNQQLEKERDYARELLKNGKKEKALLLLKKKKFIENLMDKSEGQLENIEQMVNSLEFADLQSQVIEKMKMGNEVLKSLHDILDIDNIEEIMEETREGVEKQREIDKIFGNAFTKEDEDALLQELDELTSMADKIPAAPTNDLPKESLVKKDVKREKVLA